MTPSATPRPLLSCAFPQTSRIAFSSSPSNLTSGGKSKSEIRLTLAQNDTEIDAILFRPSAPPLLRACCELCAEGSAIYYGANTFTTPDDSGMLSSGALEAFCAPRNISHQALRTIRIDNHEYIVHTAGHFVWATQPDEWNYCRHFVVSAKPSVQGGVSIGIGWADWNSAGCRGGLDSGKLCCCAMRDLVIRYRDLVDEFAELAERTRVGSENYPGKVCKMCYRGKGMKAPQVDQGAAMGPTE